MKRHDSIVPLSRDHHLGLLFCWKIRQGLSKEVDLERLKNYSQYFWESHLKAHFEEEETILFAPLNHPFIQQALDEHEKIEQKFKDVQATDSVQPDAFLELAQKIDEHIRFEERTLFPLLQEELEEKDLEKIGVALWEIHPEPDKENYEDEFWV